MNVRSLAHGMSIRVPLSCPVFLLSLPSTNNYNSPVVVFSYIINYVVLFTDTRNQTMSVCRSRGLDPLVALWCMSRGVRDPVGTQ